MSESFTISISHSEINMSEEYPDVREKNEYGREISEKSLLAVMEQLQVNDTDTFLDLGCGRGKPLVQAVEKGCRYVVGIDFNEKVVDQVRLCFEESFYLCKPRKRIGTNWFLFELKKKGRSSFLILGQKDLTKLDYHTLKTTCQTLFPSSERPPNFVVYWYGTVFLPTLKTHICVYLLNHMPRGTRIAYVAFADTAKHGEELFDHGLNVYHLYNTHPAHRVQHLLTHSQKISDAECVDSFLYIKYALPCPKCGLFSAYFSHERLLCHFDHKRLKKEARKRLKDFKDYQERQTAQELKAIQELSTFLGDFWKSRTNRRPTKEEWEVALSTDQYYSTGESVGTNDSSSVDSNDSYDEIYEEA